MMVCLSCAAIFESTVCDQHPPVSCLEINEALSVNNGIYFARMKSPFGLNAQFCCNKYNKTLNQLHDMCIHQFCVL